MKTFPSPSVRAEAGRPRAGLAVCEFLMAFAVIIALALLLMPVAPVAPEAAAGEPRPARFRLHDALMHFQTSLEGVMVEPRDG